MINIDNLDELSLYEVDLLIEQIENSSERGNLQKVKDRRNQIIKNSKFLGEDVPEDISNMSLKELYECREVLVEQERSIAKKELEEKVVAKAKKYTEGKGVIPTSEDLYILRDLLDKAYDNDDHNNNTKYDIRISKDKVRDDIANFEACYGIDDEHLRTPATIEKNLDFIEKNIPSAEDLFEDNELSELNEVKGVLDNLVIKGDFTLWGRKTIKGKEAEEIKSLLKEQVYQDTSRYLANTKENGLGQEEFAQEYSDRMKMALLRMFEAEDVVRVIAGKKPENLEEKFGELTKQEKPIEINREVIASYNAISNVEANTATKRLGLRAGYADVVSRYKEKIKALDEKCKKTPLYSFAKTALVSGAWGTAFGVATAISPTAVAVVSLVSVTKAGYSMYKDYKKQKKEDETLSFDKYMKKNPTRVAGAVLSAVSASMGIAGAVLPGGFENVAVQGLVRGSGMSLGAINTVKAYKNAPKGKKLGAAAKVAGSFVVGMVAGRAGADAVNLAEVVDFSEFGNSAQAAGPQPIEEYKPINEEVGPSSQQLQGNQSVVDTTQNNGTGNTQQYQQNDHNSGSGGNADNSQGNMGNNTSNENGEFQDQKNEHEESNNIDDSMNNYELQTQNVEVGKQVDILDSNGNSIYQVVGKEGYNTSYTEGYYTETEPNIVKVEYEEIATGNKEVVYVGMDAPLFKEEYGDRNNLLSYSEFTNGKEEVLVREYEYDENCDKVIKTIHYEGGYATNVVEITYNEDGSETHVHKDPSYGDVTRVVNVSNAGEQSIEMIMGEDLNNNQDVSENNGDGKEDTPKGNNAEQDDNQIQNTEGSLSEERQSSHEAGSTTLQGGENAGENNKAELDNSQAQNTEGPSNAETRPSNNGDSNSDGAKILGGIAAEVLKEEAALNEFYGNNMYTNQEQTEYYLKGADGEKLFSSESFEGLKDLIEGDKKDILDLDDKLQLMKSKGEIDSKEYLETKRTLDNLLEERGFERNEDGLIMKTSKTNSDDTVNTEQIKEEQQDNSQTEHNPNQQGGENSGEGNKAESENIATEQTSGKDDNTEKQSDGKLSEEEKLAHMSAQARSEDIALNEAYGQHYMNKETGECYVKDAEGNILLKGNDPNELNRNIEIHKNELFKMDTDLHIMEVNDLKDTQEYQDLADKLNNKLDDIGMVRDEETGRMMSKSDYTALQEQRQAETQVGENNNAGQDNSQAQNTEVPSNAETSTSNEDGSTTPQGGENSGEGNKAESENIATEQTSGNEEKTADTKGNENKQPTEQDIIKNSAIQVNNNIVIGEAKNNLHLYQDENGKKYWAQSPGGERVASGESGRERFMLTFQKEETFLTAMEKSGQTDNNENYQRVLEEHQKKEQLLGIEKDEKGIYRHVEDNKANNHANGEHTKTHETQTQSKSPSWMNKLRNR